MAGARIRNRLTALAVEKQKRPGTYSDGAGLSLIVTEAGVKRWELRIAFNGRRRQLGLGIFPEVTLNNARRNASELRRANRESPRPPSGRRKIAQPDAPLPKLKTFREAFDSYFEMKEQQLSNSKHAAQWRSTMKTYVFPAIGERPVAEVTASEVIDLLKPIWNEKPETAKRVLQRIRVVFEAAIVRGDRQSAAPTTGLTTVLGSRNRAGQSHHAALPYAEVPGFVRHLRQQSGLLATRLAFEFLILTAARSSEVRQATWDEFDMDGALWRIPAERMKARDPHVVPLSTRALELLRAAHAAEPASRLVFPGARRGRPLSDMATWHVLRSAGLKDRATAHGFRSSFKDWCAEVAKVRDEVSEAALAHKIPNRAMAGSW